MYRRVNTLLSLICLCLLYLVNKLMKQRQQIIIPSIIRRPTTFISSDNEEDYANFAVVDYQRPPICRNLMQESLRFNELLAYSLYQCKKKMQIFEQTNSFSLCLDPGIGLSMEKENFTFLTITNTFDDLEFEKALLRLSKHQKVKKGLVISPGSSFNNVKYANSIFRNHVTHHAASLIPDQSIKIGDADESSKLLSIDESSSSSDDDGLKILHVKDIEKLIANHTMPNNNIDVMKIDCSRCWSFWDQPRLINEIIESGLLKNVRQLHIQIRLDHRDSKNSHLLLHQWYLIMHKLYYKAKFAYYSATQSGECGSGGGLSTVIKHCQYKISLVKIDANEKHGFMAPISGMGMPEEEYERLISYLTNAGAIKNSSFSFPDNKYAILHTINLDRIQVKSIYSVKNGCKIFILSYQNQNLHYENLEGCHIFVLKPDLDGFLDGHAADFKWLPYNESMDDVIFRSMDQISIIDLLIIDLDGFEFDVLQEMVAWKCLKKIMQIYIRFPIWLGEENENYRRLYANFIALEQRLGYRLIHAGKSSSSIDNNDQQNFYELLLLNGKY